jgi:hypothetical protein
MTEMLKLCSSVTHGGKYKLEAKTHNITQSQASNSSNVLWVAISCGDFTGGCSQPVSALGCKLALFVQIHGRIIALKPRHFHNMDILLFLRGMF